LPVHPVHPQKRTFRFRFKNAQKKVETIELCFDRLSTCQYSTSQPLWVVSTYFQDWLAARGGDGSIEIKQAIERIEHLLVTNEFSDRVYDLREGDTKTIRNLLAYRKVGLEKETEEFWVPPTVFDKEFVLGVNKAELVKELQRIGWLLPPRADGKAFLQRQVNNKRNYYYVFGKRVFDGEHREHHEQQG
jgi:putative DNA primase/helicase